MLINDENRDLVHHLLLYECDALASFNDSNLPRGICDEMLIQAGRCMLYIAIGWAVGGQMVRICCHFHRILRVSFDVDRRISCRSWLSNRWKFDH